MQHKFLSLASLSFCFFLLSCASNRPDCKCDTNPCRTESHHEQIPAVTLLSAYNATALSQFVPPYIRLMPARIFYDLLSNGNGHDSRTWYVGQRELSKNRILNHKKPISVLDVAYTGFIEVFPPQDIKGAQCRVFHQSISQNTKIYGVMTYRSQGMACARGPEMWKVTYDRNF